MHNFSRKFIGVVALVATLGISDDVFAQSQGTEHTFRLDDASSRPVANLEDVSWLVGSWSGEAFGGTLEEVWNPPSAGSMVGMYKLMKGDQVSFYELVIIVEQEDSLSLKLKHFNNDLTGWEERDEVVTFRLAKIEEDAIHFSGLSFYHINDDEFHAYLALHREGKTREEKLVYRRRY